MQRLRTLLLAVIIALMDQTGHAQINYLELPKDRQFDFWVGEWDVNLRVKQPDNSWLDQIKSTAKIYSINKGRAILELWNDSRPRGIKGFSLRYYNFENETWDLWLNWPGGNFSSLGAGPMRGNFRHGRGEFQGGKGDTLTVYSFSDISPYYLRWDDKFTKDGGKTWTNGWIMEFTRTAQEPTWPDAEQAHTYDTPDRCTLEEFDAFRMLKGKWSGTIKEKVDGTWKEGSAEMDGYEVLNGCAVLNFMKLTVDGETRENFSLKTYNLYAKVLEDGQLDDGKEDILRRYFGTYSADSKQYEMEESAAKDVLIKKFIWDLSEDGKVTVNIMSGINNDNPTWEKIGEISLTKK